MSPGSLSTEGVDPSTPANADTVSKAEALCQIITPVGMLGYGFDENLTRKALVDLRQNPTPTALILDSGSTDGGPLKLATGSMTAPRSAYERDLAKLMALSYDFNVPIIISSAGGDGSDAHVDEFLSIIEGIASDDNNKWGNFKALAIYSNVAKSKVLEHLAAGKVEGCGPCVPPLNITDVDDAGPIVAQMGHEPFLDAMAAQPDFNIIIGGRAYDPSPYIAYCAHQAHQVFYTPLKSLTPQQLGGFAFMGKIMECGALCSTPKSSSAMATIYTDGTFDIVPLSPESICTPTSVAAHTMYEKTRPDILPGPGGKLDLSYSQYEQLPDNRSVRVRGALFRSAQELNLPYTVKLEAAKTVGYRTLIMGGIRDPILIGQIDSFLVRVKEFTKQQHSGVTESWDLDFHVYGANGVMGVQEPGDSSYKPREIFLVGEALAPTQKLATSVASSARIACVHGPYPGQRGTSGNFAMGQGGKLEIEMGPCAEFCIYHLMSLELGEEGASPILDSHGSANAAAKGAAPLFSWRVVEFGGQERNIPVSPQPDAAATSSRHGIKRPPTPPTYLNLSTPTKLRDIAPVIRSKNSGPYEITLDVLFSDESIYSLVKLSNLLTPATIARLYNLKEDEIIYCSFYDQAKAFKATIPRKRDGKARPSGGFMETDVHGSQQYAGLLDLELTEDVKIGIARIKYSE
ncbi:hypothetical protein V1520DRAFT_125791 [Lipomyces starkeyi]|uniref:Uncharacterized protein n=1 Tax=Lipomyces starkeyi NRRL Y-11557 TaxID=675824 RepID=A0A1E3PUD8_LIPST|nr:hypothetical protein LIPSTDRAFT_7268 [Lipomyces starkeyi NRRL Y-11557]